MDKKAKYQLFPALTPQQYKLLEQDIAARGVMVPVEVDEQGNILDGHHRVEIAERCGKSYKTITRRFATEEEKRDHIFKLNLARRQMPDHAWGRVFKKFCESRGVRTGSKGHGRGGPEPKELKVNVALNPKRKDTVASLAEECDVSERTAKRRLKAAREYETYDDQIQDGLDTGKVTAAQVRKEHSEPKARTAKSKPCPKGRRGQKVQCPKCGHSFRV